MKTLDAVKERKYNAMRYLVKANPAKYRLVRDGYKLWLEEWINFFGFYQWMTVEGL